jgi:hypothetical protein
MLLFSKTGILNTFNCKSVHYFFIIAFSITMVGLSIENVNTFPVHIVQAQISTIPGQQNSLNDNFAQQNQQNTIPDQQNQQNSETSQTNGPKDINFIMSGPLSSFIRTSISDWVVNGNWSLTVQNGKLISFDGQMRWDPTNVTKSTTVSHTHSFSNFKAQPTNTSIVLGPKNMMDIKGIMDVGANAKKDNWKDVPSEIKTAGNTITITLEYLKTDHHFNQYPIFGKIDNTIRCSANPFGANMEILDIPACP